MDSADDNSGIEELCTVVLRLCVGEESSDLMGVKSGLSHPLGSRSNGSAKPMKFQPCNDFYRALFSEVWCNYFPSTLNFSPDTIWHYSFFYEP